MKESEQTQQSPKPTKPQKHKPLSSRDEARLMTNDPRVANHFIDTGGKRVAIIHLGLKDLAIFNAVVEPLEALMTELRNYVVAGHTVGEFIRDNFSEVRRAFVEDVPLAASIALRLSEKKCRRLHPLCLLLATYEQWEHNTEIGRLAEMFAQPESDDDELDQIYDDEAENPVDVIESLVSAYNWPKSEVYTTTMPLLFLMGVSAAWKHKRIDDRIEQRREEAEAEDGQSGDKGAAPAGKHVKMTRKDRKGRIFFEDEYWESFREMGAERYKRYEAALFKNKDGSM